MTITVKEAQLGEGREEERGEVCCGARGSSSSEDMMLGGRGRRQPQEPFAHDPLKEKYKVQRYD